MRLITKIKLQANLEQNLLLKQTLDVCKEAFNLSAQTTILCIRPLV